MLRAIMARKRGGKRRPPQATGERKPRRYWKLKKRLKTAAKYGGLALLGAAGLHAARKRRA